MFGLGCVLYRAATLKLAKDDEHKWNELEFPESFDEDLKNLLLAMMSRKPEDRPSLVEIDNTLTQIAHKFQVLTPFQHQQFSQSNQK